MDNKFVQKEDRATEYENPKKCTSDYSLRNLQQALY